MKIDEKKFSEEFDKVKKGLCVVSQAICYLFNSEIATRQSIFTVWNKNKQSGVAISKANSEQFRITRLENTVEQLTKLIADLQPKLINDTKMGWCLWRRRRNEEMG